MQFSNNFLCKIGKTKKISIIISAIAVSLIFGCNSIEDIEVKNIEIIRTLNEKNINAIEIYKDGNMVLKIDNPNEIKDFTNSLIDLTLYHPNHPNYLKEWFVKITLKNEGEEKFYLMQEKNDQIYLYVNPLGNRWLGGGGTARSKLLYGWIVKKDL